MNEIRINLEGHQRVFYSALPVRSVGYVEHEHLNKFQMKPNILQIGIRLKSAQKSIHNTIDGKQYENHFPHVVIKLPGVACLIEEDVFAEVLYVTYNKNFSKEFETRHMLSDGLAWDIALSVRTQYLIDELIHLTGQSSEYGNADRIDQVAFMLFQELLLCRHSEKNDTVGKLSRVESFLHVHFRDEINYEKLAYSAGMSRRTLFRYWKTHYHTTPGEYVYRLKLKDAEFLLTESSRSIEEISESLHMGFAYFCAVFKKYYGLTPLQFRKKNIKH